MSAAVISRRDLLAGMCASALVAACTGGGLNDDSTAVRNANRRQALLDQAARSGVNQGLVSLAVVYQDSGQRLGAIAGVRDLVTQSPAMLEDIYRMGSCSKTLTCYLAAALVEQGTIAWSTTLASALPELAAGMLPVYQAITLEDLLNHLGGVLAFNDIADIDIFLAYLAAQAGPLPTTFAGRESFFAQWLLAQQPPDGVVPGQTFYYSNAGYVLAAMMLKQAAGQDFPTLFERYVSQPLNGWVWIGSRSDASHGMTTGYQGSVGGLATPPAIPTDLEPWNEVLNQPAGDVYSTPLGYSLWLQTLAAALRGESTAVPAAYVAKLTAAATGDYVLGWESGSLDGRDAFAHTGIIDGYTCIAVVDRSGGATACALSNTESPDIGTDWVTPAMFDALVSVDTAW